ncbi:MAG: hypothetical protein A2Y40_01080 [Candidatus Margulisbacteria bacterium GWF2_35_9]|nr:MAG: hypothetical protein A2Y40_01080 [Candidatus Margulisbacteria bacterium GWF2_35_9]
MRTKLKGKILFVFSDPGGAKPCLSLIEENNLSNVIAVSDRRYSFYHSFKTPVKIVNKNFEELIKIINPELIFTGTSYTSNIEQQFINIALKNRIRCYSFIDHWTSISKRFKNLDGKMILPDQVWVIDERAKQLAIEEGIDKDRLVISGNPYHDWLLNWKPTINREAFFKQVGLQHINQKILVYAPDPLSNVKGKEVFGFDELSATSVLVELFKKYPTKLKGWKILVKAHPNQDRDKLNKIIERHKTFYILPEEVDINLALFYADAVIGFFSSVLIEATIMNKPVLRFLDGLTKNDPIVGLNVGMITNRNTFITMLSKITL